MADAEVTPTGPIPHDGWHSRKIIAGLSTAGAFFASSTVGWLVLDKMTAAEWTNANMMLAMPTVLIALGFLTAEKWIAKNR